MSRGVWDSRRLLACYVVEAISRLCDPRRQDQRALWWVFGVLESLDTKERDGWPDATRNDATKKETAPAMTCWWLGTSRWSPSGEAGLRKRRRAGTLQLLLTTQCALGWQVRTGKLRVGRGRCQLPPGMHTNANHNPIAGQIRHACPWPPWLHLLLACSLRPIYP